MSSEFEKLNRLEKNKKVTIGVKTNHANNYWYSQTIIGKILNWITSVLIILSIYIFVKYSIMMGIIAMIGIGLYVIIIQKIALLYVRLILLENEVLFNEAYRSKSVTIMNNADGNISYYPKNNWDTEITKIIE